MNAAAAGMLAGAALAMAAPAYGQTSTSVFQSVSGVPAVDTATQAHDVRFRRDSHDRMTVSVELGGNGPFNFLVDTGADRTALSAELATRLKLPSGRTAHLHSVTGVTAVQTVKMPDLHLSRRSIRLADAPLLKSEHIGADGILGIDSLRSQRVLFDFKKRLMTIVPSARPAADDRDAIVVRARQRNGRLVLTDATADGIPVTIVLDTGSEVCMANEALRRRLEQRGRLRSAGRVTLESVTGEKLVGDHMVLKRLDLGKVGLEQLAVVFADAHTFKRLELLDTPAILLGMNGMRGFEKVSIDFARRQLRVVVPESSAIDGARMAAAAVEAGR